MDQRRAMLLVSGVLAFGSLGYFLFLYDDGTAPRFTTSHHRARAAASAVLGAGLNGPGRTRVPASAPSMSIPSTSLPEPTSVPSSHAPSEGEPH
ncbi:MAG TPA: hypothetical protein VGM56_29905 [Byssovorax sp.]|jgi:hypothetical protein